MVNPHGAKCVVVAVFGNRAYDDALLEMQDVASETGFRVIAAVAGVAYLLYRYFTPDYLEDFDDDFDDDFEDDFFEDDEDEEPVKKAEEEKPATENAATEEDFAE